MASLSEVAFYVSLKCRGHGGRQDQARTLIQVIFWKLPSFYQLAARKRKVRTHFEMKTLLSEFHYPQVAKGKPVGGQIISRGEGPFWKWL